MKKISLVLLSIVLLGACSKRDPILPGVRSDIFDDGEIVVKNQDVPELSDSAKNIYGDENCPYSQDATNTIFEGDKKIWVGFATNSTVKTKQTPICDGRFVYAGLSSGEVIKLNPKNKKLVWTTDVFKTSSLTGGTYIVDIIARVGLDGKYVYAGGLGDAFCKINAGDGSRVWCLDISVPVDFTVVDDFAFVVGADNNLYAINTKSGEVYWKTEIKKQVKPIYDGKFITVGKQTINYKNGTIEKTSGWF